MSEDRSVYNPGHYDYKIVDVDAPEEVDTIKRLTAKGWRLVAVNATVSLYSRLYFERRSHLSGSGIGKWGT